MSAHAATSSTNTGKSAPAVSGSTRESLVEGNTTGAAGSRTGPIGQPTVGEEMGVTLGNDFRLANTKADPRESDLTEPNALAGDMASTAGPGGDAKHREATAHETKGLRQRLENADEREDREARGYDEPINRMRQPTDTVNP
ncbi:uncharacterized protein JCM10292_002003 [Rhodotorula paludigena]|uniref:uncharacterized protein n=1 Tax=Rhodotorula paludigena TaxID=86838 RepID=UPI00316C2802